MTGLLVAAALPFADSRDRTACSWVAESLIRRRFRQAAIRAAVSAFPPCCGKPTSGGSPGATNTHQPTYAYQRAPYYYANVTYRENSSLVDPFCPELGRTASQ